MGFLGEVAPAGKIGLSAWLFWLEHVTVGMFSIKKLIRFCWILPGIYLVVLVIYILGLISGAGHIPHSFAPLFYVLGWPSYVVDLLLPKAGTHNPVVDLILFVVIGLLAYALIGFLIDIAIRTYQHRRRV